MPIELGVLGAGNMAEAVAAGVVRAGLLKVEQIVASDVSRERRELFTGRLGIRAVDDNRQVAASARMILLSVKPQQMATVLADIAVVLNPQTLIVSIAAGISSRFIETQLDATKPWRVVRTMPNTPMLIGEGMVALARGKNATRDDVARARQLFECAASVIEVEEDKMDAVTAVSGSGPAYIFYLVEQMVRAAIDLGLSPADSRTLAIKTALGAAKMLASSTDSAEELRRKVTSPGGTTQAAITHLQQHDWPAITADAVKAAAKRGRELGN